MAHTQKQIERERGVRHKQSTTDTEHTTRINDNKQVEYEETKEQTERGVSRIAWGAAARREWGMGNREYRVGSRDPCQPALLQGTNVRDMLSVCVLGEGASLEKGVGAISGLVFMMLI